MRLSGQSISFIKRFYTQKKNIKKSMQANIRLKHSNKKNLSTSYAPYVFYLHP